MKVRAGYVHRWIALALLILGVWSIGTLSWQTELLPLFPQKLGSVQALARLEARERGEPRLLVVAAPSHTLSEAETREALDRVAAALRVLPEVLAVHEENSSASFLTRGAAWSFTNAPPKKFHDILEAVTPQGARKRLAETRLLMTGALDEEALALLRMDPLRLHENLDFPFFDSQAQEGRLPLSQALCLAVVAAKPLAGFRDCQRFYDAVRKVLDVQIANPEVRSCFLLTGRPAFVAEISKGMQRDLHMMIAVTAVLVLGLFALVYRTLRALGWILAAQALSILAALAAARLTFGGLNVLSMGFGCMLLGVGIDYCILVYHHFARGETRAHEGWKTLRRGIWLSAFTTAAAFGVLVFSSFPGLQQLSVLVATGLLVTAWAATTLLAAQWEAYPPSPLPSWANPGTDAVASWIGRNRFFILGGLAVFVVLGGALLNSSSRISFYSSDWRLLQPVQLEAYRGQALLTPADGQGMLQQFQTTGSVEDLNSPSNRQAWIPGRGTALGRVFQENGFSRDWAAPTLAVLAELDAWKQGDNTLEQWAQDLRAWPNLQQELSAAALEDFKRLAGGVAAALIVLSFAAHRSWKRVALNLASLGIALFLWGALLWATGTQLTVVSILCVPLLMGLSIDYSIHVLLVLEQTGGDLRSTFRHLGAPLTLTGLCSIIGFSAPFLTSQPALQNFGLVMDLGVVAAVVSNLLILPALERGSCSSKPSNGAGGHHSFLYGAWGFEIAALAGRILPRSWMRALGRLGGGFYAWLRLRGESSRSAVLPRNLALLGKEIDPVACARRTYPNFGMTLADYFYIGSVPRKRAAQIITERSGYEHLKAVHDAGKGCLLVTAHLGLFELGGLLMGGLGFPTVALTLPEPSEALTRWRAAFRKRWGVETVAIGEDTFSFVEIVRLIRQGRFVAALIDRPHSTQNSMVQFPGGQAAFSSGLVLLALLAPCPVIVVTVVETGKGHYRVEAHPPFEPRWEGTREETLARTSQKIADLLLPTLRRYPDQWYPFVSIEQSSRPA